MPVYILLFYSMWPSDDFGHKFFILLTSKNQYPTFRVMVIDLAAHVGTCFPPVYHQGSWKSTFLPPDTALRRQWLLADTAMKCYMSSQTQGECFLCQILPSSPAASLTQSPSSNLHFTLITFFKEIDRCHLSYCIKGSILIFCVLLPLTQMN